MAIKVFADGANLEGMLDMYENGNVQGFNINLIGRIDELGLACGSLLLQDRHFQLYPFG